MPAPLAGPGQGLPVNQYLYPSELYNAPYDFSANTLSIAGGDALPIQAGTWLITLGPYGFMQFNDPTTGTFRGFSSARSQQLYVKSDGYNIRVANLTGCPVAAIVTGAGSGYTQASTTIAASGSGGSTWAPIVGGQLSVVTVGTTGSGYGVAPFVFIPAPPQGAGVQATAYATISAGTVSGVTLSNVGAGYTTAPTAQILPNPTDPNINTITQATVTFGLTSAGKIAAALCTNPGAPLAGATPPTLTVSGTGGSGATLAAVMCQTVQSASISGAGVGYGTFAYVTTMGGTPTQVPAFTNPAIELTGFIPRPAQIQTTLTAGSLTAIGNIVDGGMFMATPAAYVTGTGAVTTAATVLLTMGTLPDTVIIQGGP